MTTWIQMLLELIGKLTCWFSTLCICQVWVLRALRHFHATNRLKLDCTKWRVALFLGSVLALTSLWSRIALWPPEIHILRHKKMYHKNKFFNRQIQNYRLPRDKLQSRRHRANFQMGSLPCRCYLKISQSNCFVLDHLTLTFHLVRS